MMTVFRFVMTRNHGVTFAVVDFPQPARRTIPISARRHPIVEVYYTTPP